MVGVPGPEPNFVTSERTFLRTHYSSLSDAQQDDFAHVERDFPVTEALLAKADPTKKAQWIQRARQYGHDSAQLATRTVDVLAQTYAVQENNIEESIILMSSFNFNMLYHRGYYNHY